MVANNISTLIAVRDVDALRRRIKAWRREGKSVALVPTMGALHKGHLTLMDRAQKMADCVVASLFVNPKQFGPSEDFTAYPRRENADFELLNTAGVHLLFAPDVNVMYPAGFSTSVRVEGLSGILDGAHRPGHFDGVSTIVTKLLLQAAPDVAVFGEKDYQQLVVIRRLVRDLDIPVEIIGGPTIRAPDGLALSSRNAYLTAAERAQAPALHEALTQAANRLRAGEPVARVEADAIAALRAAGFSRIDYVEARDAESLERLGPGLLAGPPRLLAAAVLGKTRQIDNLAV